uniref:Uncharacterized protein n=1 Tax=Mycena chlorophos TaxID=658473 RepID=A0ABQ0LQS2_MYCCL|nr:predicted protein [Mycena chlorophos]
MAASQNRPPFPPTTTTARPRRRPPSSSPRTRTPRTDTQRRPEPTPRGRPVFGSTPISETAPVATDDGEACRTDDDRWLVLPGRLLFRLQRVLPATAQPTTPSPPSLRPAPRTYLLIA